MFLVFLILFFCTDMCQDFHNKHSSERRCVIGPENTVCMQVCLCIFQLGNVTGWGSERVNGEQKRGRKLLQKR